MTDTLKAEISKLSPEEKRALAAELWQQLEETQELHEEPQWLIDELDRRAVELEKHPELGISMDELMRRVRARHGR